MMLESKFAGLDNAVRAKHTTSNAQIKPAILIQEYFTLSGLAR
ncbi:hypothetical protein GLIP_0488 [Aliiglaciecola lipolytica E3]|uniref:Uncharacterized protein n=1 Tax=Aliiglaciecola lipolytica E3 TaxID=1127673 RepID=K6WXE8_9ALTE|nr:hypothetical protein GLIP_0488 [Aliiglaciecola lipolytica E3]